MEGAEASMSSLLVGDAAPLVAQGHWRRGSCLTRMAGESYRRFWSLPWPREPVCLPRASLLEKCSLQMLWMLGKSLPISYRSLSNTCQLFQAKRTGLCCWNVTTGCHFTVERNMFS